MLTSITDFAKQVTRALQSVSRNILSFKFKRANSAICHDKVAVYFRKYHFVDVRLYS